MTLLDRGRVMGIGVKGAGSWIGWDEGYGVWGMGHGTWDIDGGVKTGGGMGFFSPTLSASRHALVRLGFAFFLISYRFAKVFRW